MDNAILLMLFGLPALLVLALYVMCAGYSDLILMHLVIVWLEIYPYGAIWLLFGRGGKLDPYAVGLVGLLMVVYIVSFIVLGRAIRNYYGLVSKVALSIPRVAIVCAFVAYLGFKAFLVHRYGLLVFGSLKLRVLAGVPHALVDIDALLLIPAMGAYFAYTIQAARLGRKVLNPILLGLWLLFLLVNLIAEASGGGKRMMILTALTALLMLPDRRFRLSLRTAGVALAMVVAVALLSDRYQALRENFWELRREVTHIELGKALALLVKPKTKYLDLATDISIRPTPLDLLYTVTEKQLRGQGTTRGVLVTQAFVNSAPGLLVKKEFVDDDDLIADFFRIRHIDYPTTVLAEFQAESFLPAYFIVPGMYVALFWLYLALLERYRFKGWLLPLALVGILITTCGSFETSLTSIVSNLRNTCVLLALSLILACIPKIRFRDSLPYQRETLHVIR